jgi:ribosomal protein L35AE/L33A
MTREGERVNVTVREREDYVGDEVVTRDGEGRPIMAVNVERAHGNDVAVFAPMAKVEHE